MLASSVVLPLHATVRVDPPLKATTGGKSCTDTLTSAVAGGRPGKSGSVMLARKMYVTATSKVSAGMNSD